MGQSKLPTEGLLDAPLDFCLLHDDESQEAFGTLSFPFHRHLKGRSRLSEIQGRAGSIIALVMNPHQPEVLGEARKIYTPEAGAEYIPAIQELGRSLLRLNWYARVEMEEVGLYAYEALMFYSSEAVADRLGMGEHLTAVDPARLVQMAVKAGHTIA